MKKIILTLLCFGLFSCEEPTYVILMAGQSNMVGKGDITEIDNPKIPSNIQYYNFGHKPGFKALPKNQFGPEIGLAQILASKYPNRNFIFIKYAIGSSSILNWAPDYNFTEAKITGAPELFGEMYADFKHKTDSILKNINHKKIALLWMQGEKDARFPESASNYFSNLKELIIASREDFKNNDLPFIFGEVNPLKKKYISLDVIRKAQRAISQKVGNSYLIETDDLNKLADSVHYSSIGQIELGKRFGEKIIQLEN